MKTIIENMVAQPQGMHPDNVALRNEINSEFIAMLNGIKYAKNEAQLRHYFAIAGTFGGFKYFAFGFGGNHMWVKQIVDGEMQKDRVMFVEF